MDKNTSQKPKKQLSTYTKFSGVVIQMATIIGIGTFLGSKLDKMYPNKYNLLTLFCVLFSVVTSIIYAIRRIIATSKEEQ